MATPNPTDDANTELARLNRELRMVSSCNRALIRATREDELLHEVCRLAVDVGGYIGAWVGFVLHDAKRTILPVAAVGLDIDFLGAIGLTWFDAPGGRGPTGRAVRERTVQVTHDIGADPVLTPWHEQSREHGFASIIALPLMMGDECIGIFGIYSARANAFDETETALLRELADDLAYGINALRTAREHEKAQENLTRFRRLLDRSNDFIYVLDAKTGRMLDANDALARRLGCSRDELLQMAVQDFSLTAGERPWPELLAKLRNEGFGVRESHYRARDGTLFPVEVNITLVEEDRHPYIIAVSRDVTERRQQEEQITRLARALRMQSAIGLAVLRIGDRDELLKEACRIATELGGYDVAAVSIVDPDGRHARPVHRAGRSAFPPVFEISDGTTPDTSLTGLALRTGQLVACGDLTQTELPIAGRESLYEEGVRSIVGLPLIVDGAKVGVLTMTSPIPGRMPDEEIRLLQDIMATLSFALRSQQQADAVQYLAYFDSVTGLAKRALFCDRLNSQLRNRLASETAPAVVAFCVDRLGSINDRFGGNFGDRLLKGVAERLRRHAESDDVIGYLGGGTFVAAQPASATPDLGISAALDNALLSAAFSIDGRVIRVSATAGVARYGRDGEDADALVRSAEAALSRARDTSAEFAPDVIVAHSEASDRIALEHRLRKAIDARQFEVHYLPRIEIATGRVICVEAQLNLNDPKHGSLAAGELLPALELSGLIFAVGQWLLQSAIDDGIRWQALGIGPLRIAVPVSALQIRRRAFGEQCRKLHDRWAVRLRGYGIDLELSEPAFLQDVEGTARKLAELRNVGIHIALDGFGTGYSSLGVLSKLPLDLIKIEGSLIRGLPEDARSRAMVGSIVSLASAFNLTTVAEGVETPEQLLELRRLKCDQCQGSLVGPPSRAAELERLLGAWSGNRPLA